MDLIQCLTIDSKGFCPHLGTDMCKKWGPVKNAEGVDENSWITFAFKLHLSCCSSRGPPKPTSQTTTGSRAGR